MSRKDERDNRSNQMNPNNDACWTSRGYDQRPGDWKKRSTGGKERQERPGKKPAPKK